MPIHHLVHVNVIGGYQSELYGIYKQYLIRYSDGTSKKVLVK